MCVKKHQKLNCTCLIRRVGKDEMTDGWLRFCLPGPWKKLALSDVLHDDQQPDDSLQLPHHLVSLLCFLQFKCFLCKKCQMLLTWLIRDWKVEEKQWNNGSRFCFFLLSQCSAHHRSNLRTRNHQGAYLAQISSLWQGHTVRDFTKPVFIKLPYNSTRKV